MNSVVASESDYRNILRGELERRCRQAPKYGLRAFARDLKLSPSRLSEVLSGKQGLSAEVARGLALKLGYTRDETEVFCDLVESEHGRARVSRELARKRLERHRMHARYEVLRDDVHRVVADWQHFAILELINLPDFKSDPAWVARSLDISMMEAKGALDRLERLQLVRRDEKGGYVGDQAFRATSEEIPAEVMRRAHQGVLHRAGQALERQSRDEREYSANILCIDPEMLPEAKRWIRNFRRRFDRKLASKKASQVYCLSIQFFNLTHTKDHVS